MADIGNSIGITPDRLREVAPEFRSAAQDTFTLISQLDYARSSLISELHGAQLSRSPDALEGLLYRWHDALTNLAHSMQIVANNLDVAANSYQTTDQNVMHTTP